MVYCQPGHLSSSPRATVEGAHAIWFHVSRYWSLIFGSEQTISHFLWNDDCVLCQVFGDSVWDPKDDPLSPDHQLWCKVTTWAPCAWLLTLPPQENVGPGDSPELYSEAILLGSEHLSDPLITWPFLATPPIPNPVFSSPLLLVEALCVQGF